MVFPLLHGGEKIFSRDMGDGKDDIHTMKEVVKIVFHEWESEYWSIEV